MKYGAKKFPYILAEDRIVFSHEIKLTDKEIAELTETVGKELKSVNVSNDINNKVQLFIEAAMQTIKQKNNPKLVFSDCNIIIDDEELQLIIRDDGTIFDITDSDSEIVSLSSYVTAMLMNGGQKNAHLIATSFNRNSFTWKL